LFFQQLVGEPAGTGPAIEQGEGNFTRVHTGTLTQPREELEDWSAGGLGV
jgi:hypothetical protein